MRSRIAGQFPNTCLVDRHAPTLLVIAFFGISVSDSSIQACGFEGQNSFFGEGCGIFDFTGERSDLVGTVVA